MGLIARWRAERKKRQAVTRMLDQLTESRRELARVYVKLALVGIDHDAAFVAGQRYTCLFCGKRYRQEAGCSWGFCRRCS